MLNLILYQIYPHHYKQDYLIVLGAGLLNGDQVSKLLAARINRAIQFSNRQYQKGRKRPIIIMSGGQGPDEKIPEAVAMARFAQHRGISPSEILIEDQSKNTYQNMLFSLFFQHLFFGCLDFDPVTSCENKMLTITFLLMYSMLLV